MIGLFLMFRNLILPPLCGRQKLNVVLVDPCMARRMLAPVRDRRDRVGVVRHA